MMIDFHKLKDVKTSDICMKNKKMYSNVIYTLDIETSSLFYLNNKWSRFIYNDNIDYRDIPKAAVPYIWMFGINDKVYYGREFYNFEDVLKQISDPLICKTIWVFNLSFEFCFLMNILQDYTIEKMVAREKRKPISFYVKELNIIFRCAYMLTNMKLEDAAKFYTHVKKLSGDLDYNKERSPLTKLDDTEMLYCEYDIISLYEVILTFLDKYRAIPYIPLTSTSTVRYAIKQEVNYFYIKAMQDLVPPVDMYLKFWYAFSGGYTHCNILKTSKILTAYKKGYYTEDGEIDKRLLIKSMDESSCYPAALVTEKYPCRPFLKCDPSMYYDPEKREKFAFVMRVECIDISSRYYNNYLQYEKVKNDAKRPVTDNGRIVALKYGTLWCTCVDLDILRANYRGTFNILECYRSFKKYLDIRIIKFILKMFQNKTKLKNIVDESDEQFEYYDNLYKSSKALLNGIYGMAVTSILHTADFRNNDWSIPLLLDPDAECNKGLSESEMFTRFVDSKLDDARESFSTLFYYPTGIFCTSYCRRNIFMRLISSKEFDKAAIYVDTDSVKYQGNYDYIFEEYNKSVYQKYLDVIKYYPGLKVEDFTPADPKGKIHSIGYFEIDGLYTEFVSHGAKKYCYRDYYDGKLHLTVSGVSKKGVKYLFNDIRRFKKDFKWGYKESGKLIHTYADDQETFTFTDIDGNDYTSTYKHSVILQPTSYTLGLTDLYESLSKLAQLGYMAKFER